MSSKALQSYTLDKISRKNNPNETPYNTSAPITTDNLSYRVLRSVADILEVKNIIRLEEISFFNQNEEFAKDINSFVEKYTQMLKKIEDLCTILGQFDNDNLPDDLKGKDLDYYIKHKLDTSKINEKMRTILIKVLEEIDDFKKNILRDFTIKYIEHLAGTVEPDGTITSVPTIYKNYVDRYHENDPYKKESMHIYGTQYQALDIPNKAEDTAVFRLFKIDAQKNSKIKSITTPDEIVDLIIDFDRFEDNDKDELREALIVTTKTKSNNIVRDPTNHFIKHNFIHKGFSEYDPEKVYVRNVKGHINHTKHIGSTTSAINNFEEPESITYIGLKQKNHELFVDSTGNVVDIDLKDRDQPDCNGLARQIDMQYHGDDYKYLVVLYDYNH